LWHIEVYTITELEIRQGIIKNQKNLRILICLRRFVDFARDFEILASMITL